MNDEEYAEMEELAKDFRVIVTHLLFCWSCVYGVNTPFVYWERVCLPTNFCLSQHFVLVSKIKDFEVGFLYFTIVSVRVTRRHRSQTNASIKRAGLEPQLPHQWLAISRFVLVDSSILVHSFRPTLGS